MTRAPSSFRLCPAPPQPRRGATLRALLGALCVLGTLAGAAGTASATALNLDPFRRAPASTQAVPLLKLSQAEQAPAETPAPAPRAATPARAVPPPTSPSPAAPVACTEDAQCPDETICEGGTCRRIEQRTNIFYLYYQEGSFREVLGLYWSKRGNTGYTVVAPFYWNYFSPTSRSRVVAPFYWHFEDDAAKSRMTVIVPGLPVMWSSAPDARAFAIWPLFYASSKFGWAAPLLGSFRITNPEKQSSVGAVAFLYWWSRKPDSAVDLGFPLFVSSRSAQSAFTFALPLNFYWRTGDDARTLAIPFFYRHSWNNGAGTYSPLGYVRHEGKKSSGAIAWLYWFGRDAARETAHDVFLLFWSFRSRNHGTTIVFPLVWDFRGPDSRTTVAANVFHRRSGDGWFNAFVPLWWSAGNSKEGWSFDLVAPLLFWKKSEHGKRLTWISLVGGYARDDEARSRTLTLWPIVSFFRRDPTREIDVVTPFFIRHHNIDADATTRLLAAVLYLRDDPGGSTSVLFPLVWRFWDRTTSASATAVLPFFFHRSGPRDTVTYAGVFPLWFYRRQTAEGGWGAGLFPLAFFGRSGGSSHGVLFPLFWRFADTRSSTTALLPLFVRHTDRAGSDTALPPLLVFFGSRKDGASYQVQFPLFWRFANAAAGTSTTVTPLGFVGTSPEGWRAGVGPVVPLIWAAGGGPRRHFVLFPLFWHFGDDRADSSTTVVGTFMHRRRGGETTDALFPLIYFRRGARQPGGFADSSFTLFPLIHYHRYATERVLVTPLGASASGPQRSGGFVGPFFWYRGSNVSAHGVPLLYADVFRKDTQERTRQWGPVFAVDGPGHAARVVFPLFGHYRDEHETDTFVFPSFFHQRKDEGYALDTLIPLFWHSRWKDRTTTVVGPWYRRAGDDVHNTGLAPLYFWAKNPDRTLLIVPPLLTFHRHDFRSGKVVTWVGPFVHTRSPESSSTTLFPLWWSGHKGPRSYAVLGPLYWHFADSSTASSWSLLTLAYWSRTGSARTRALLPLAWYTRDDAKQTGSEGLIPLFYASHGPGRFTLLTLLAGVSRTPEARRWYVGPLYVSDTVTSTSRFLIPLFFTHTNRTTETTTRVIPPLLHFSRSSPEKSLSTWAALFWRRSDVASATTLVLPLFLDVHDYRASRTTLLLPLFVRHANETTGDAYLLAPLIYRHTAPGLATTVGFPLYWDFKRGDRRTTVLFPVFAHWTRPTHSATWVFPNFYYRKGLAAGAPDGTWRLFIPPLFDAAVQRKGDLRWEILGGLFGKERIGRNHYLKVFFMTFETQKASQVQTSWYGQPRRVSRARPARGLATSAW